MIKIDLLKNHSHAIPKLAHIWHEVLGKIWMPELSLSEIESGYSEELKQDMPLTYVALYNQTPVGSATFQLNEDIRPELGPWLGDLVVDPMYQKQGLGTMLVNVVIKKAKDMGYGKLYLFTFDPNIQNYYERLGWKKVGMDQFKSHSVIVMEIIL